MRPDVDRPVAKPEPAAGRDGDAQEIDWVAGLTTDGPAHDATVRRLHALLVRVAHREANRRSGLNGVTGPELDDLAEQAASDAVVSILRRVGDFRGDSRFTTWAYKFVLLEVSSKLTRHAWRRTGVQLEDEHWEQLPGRLGAEPDQVAESRELVAAVRRAVEVALTPHQRAVFAAIVLQGVPLDVLVARLDTNRNAVYKTMYDARRKLRRHLIGEGHLTEDTK